MTLRQRPQPWLRNRTLTRLIAYAVRAEFPEIREVRAVRAYARGCATESR